MFTDTGIVSVNIEFASLLYHTGGNLVTGDKATYSSALEKRVIHSTSHSVIDHLSI